MCDWKFEPGRIVVARTDGAGGMGLGRPHDDAKTAPERATGAHIIIVGHITPEELRREMRGAELSSGFANRVLFACSRRSKRLARPPRMPDGMRRRLVERLRGW